MRSTMAKLGIRLAALAAGALTLGGCAYDGAGYGYGVSSNRAYDCDPYASWSSYYSCDYGHGFSNIGYGGGWYDNYYYPGQGYYVFDRAGTRHRMSDNYRDYWARQRYAHLRAHRGDYRGNDRYERRDRDRYERDRRDDRRGGWTDRRDHDDSRDGRWNGRRGDDDRSRGGWRGRERSASENPGKRDAGQLRSRPWIKDGD